MLPSQYGLVKATYTVSETIDILSVGRTSLYGLVKTGELPALKFGKKTLFATPDIVQLIENWRSSALRNNDPSSKL
jgi:excisionase family DNA binding protein